jgi:hypothetical protein
MPGSVKFTEKNGLPGTENQLALINEHSLGNSYQTCFYMGGRITLTVMVVSIERNQSGELHLNISLHCRVCTLIYSNGRSRMRDKYVAYAAGFSALIQDFLYLSGYVDEFGTFSGSNIDIPDHFISSSQSPLESEDRIIKFLVCREFNFYYN